MRLSLAIITALLFGSYVAATPVWPYDLEEPPFSGLHFAGGGASGSGSGNHLNAPLPPYPFPDYPSPSHPLLDHHNLGNFPGPASQFQPPQHPPPHLTQGGSRGGLFGVPYVCTGCGHQSPEPGPSVPADLPSRVPTTTRASLKTRIGRYRPSHSGGGGSGHGASRRPDIPCPVTACTYSSIRGFDVRRHIASVHIHSDEKKHTCPVCGAMFVKKHTLGKHRKTHKVIN